MEISSIGSSSLPRHLGPTKQITGSDFAQAFGDALHQLQQLQARADELTVQLAQNQPVDLHQVVIAGEEASLAFQLAIQVRNKVVEAYQEIMRMQV